MNRKEVIKKIGKENIFAFWKFMEGQTIGMKDGEDDFYEQDVNNFLNKLKGNPTFFD